VKSEKCIRDLKGTTEKTKKNGKTEKKVLFPIFQIISDFSVVKLEPLA